MTDGPAYKGGTKDNLKEILEVMDNAWKKVQIIQFNNKVEKQIND